MRKTILATSVAALLLSANLCAQDAPPPQSAGASAPATPGNADQAQASDPRLAKA